MPPTTPTADKWNAYQASKGTTTPTTPTTPTAPRPVFGTAGNVTGAYGQLLDQQNAETRGGAGFRQEGDSSGLVANHSSIEMMTFNKERQGWAQVGGPTSEYVIHPEQIIYDPKYGYLSPGQNMKDSQSNSRFLDNLMVAVASFIGGPVAGGFVRGMETGSMTNAFKGAATGYVGGQIGTAVDGSIGYNPTLANAVWSDSANTATSAAASGTVGAVTGAAKGGALAALTGGNPATGAINGGVSGGVSGSLSGAGVPSALIPTATSVINGAIMGPTQTTSQSSQTARPQTTQTSAMPTADKWNTYLASKGATMPTADKWNAYQSAQTPMPTADKWNAYKQAKG